jgi:(heptosyl)LPS beta-1,4-glucosyltransferase
MSGERTPRIEAVVIARDEEGSLGDCLRSLFWCDALTVCLDDRTRDRTAAVAEALGARVVLRRFTNFAAMRDAALAAAGGDWVFFVDADERSTPALADEVRRVVRGDEAGWWVPRDNYLFGRLTRHAGWYPDYQLRLLRRGCAHYDPARPVHETVLLDGAAGYLQCTLVHYNYACRRQFLAKQAAYARLEAEALAARGVRPSLHALVTQPLREFRRRFVTLEGRREGLHGLFLSATLACFTGVAYARLLAAHPFRAVL